MRSPVVELVVSPPTKSTLYCLQAKWIPAYNSSTASTGKRLDKARETVICVGWAFMAYTSERLTATALYPKCFSGT